MEVLLGQLSKITMFWIKWNFSLLQIFSTDLESREIII